MSSLDYLLIDITLVLDFFPPKFRVKYPLALSLGFPCLLEAAATTIEPADPKSGAGPGRGDPLRGANLAQLACQDWRVSEPHPGYGQCLHTGITAHCTVFAWL